MDTFDQDPKAFLDEMQIILKSRWDKLKKKCRSLEESLEKMNAERDELKMELTLSREQAIRSEKEKGELVSTLADLREEFQKNPILSIFTKVKETASFFKDVPNFAQPHLNTSNDGVPTINTISTSHVEERNTNRAVPSKETKNDVCFNSTSKSQSKESDRNSLKSLDQVPTAEDENVEKSIPIPNSSDSEPFNFDSEIPSTSSLEEYDSDIELCLSGDENVNSDFNESLERPVPASKMELIVYLPRIIFRDKCLENRVISAPQSEVHHLENGCEKKYESPKDPVVSSPKIEVHHLENDCEKKGDVKSDSDGPFCESKIVTKVINTTPTSDLSCSSSTLDLQSTPKKWYRECSICQIQNIQSDYVFDSHHALDKHLFENHPDCSPHYFRCDFGDNYCKKHFTRKPSLLRHKFQYHKDNKINVQKKEPVGQQNSITDRECLICRHENGRSDYVYKTYSALNQHLNKDHQDCSRFYFRCDFGKGTCGNYYTTKANLACHKRKVHSNKKFKVDKNAPKKGPGRGRGRRPKERKCAVCEEEFLFLDDLRKHMKEYHDICEKVGTNEDHSSQDSDETPNTCIVCDEIFLSQNGLNRHLKKVHPREFREVRKLDIDFRVKPKLLPRLRRKIDSEPDTSTELSSNKRNSEETDDAKKRKKSFDFYELVYGSPEELKQYLSPPDTKTEPRSL